MPLTIGDVSATIRADISQWVGPIRQAQAALARFESSVQQAQGTLASSFRVPPGIQGLNRSLGQIASQSGLAEQQVRGLQQSLSSLRVPSLESLRGVFSGFDTRGLERLQQSLSSLRVPDIASNINAIRQATANIDTRGLEQLQTSLTNISRSAARSDFSQSFTRGIQGLDQALARVQRLDVLQTTLRDAGLESDTLAQRIRTLSQAIQDGLVNRGLSPLTPQIQQAIGQLRGLTAEAQRLQGVRLTPFESLEQSLGVTDRLARAFRRAGIEFDAVGEKARTLGNALRRAIESGASEQTINQLTRQLAGLRQEAGRPIRFGASELARQVASLVPQLGGLSSVFLSVSTAAGTATTAFSAFAAVPIVAIIAAVAAVAKLGPALVSAGSRLEQLQAQLQAATGSSTGAAQSLALIRSEAERTGLRVSAIGGGFAQLAAATKGTRLEGAETANAFKAISTASRALFLSTQDTEGIFRAFTQTISKSKVQAEELRGQIGDRLPGAFQIAARALGVTTSALDEMLKKGQVLAEDFIPRFSAQLTRELVPAADLAGKTLQASIQRFRNSIEELLQRFAPPVLEFLNKIITRGNQALKVLGGISTSEQKSARVRLGSSDASEDDVNKLLALEEKLALAQRKRKEFSDQSGGFLGSIFGGAADKLAEDEQRITQSIERLKQSVQSEQTALAADAGLGQFGAGGGFGVFDAETKAITNDLNSLRKTIDGLNQQEILGRSKLDVARDKIKEIDKTLEDTYDTLGRNKALSASLPESIRRQVREYQAQKDAIQASIDAEKKGRREVSAALRDQKRDQSAVGEALRDAVRQIQQVEQSAVGVSDPFEALASRARIAERTLGRVRDILEDEKRTVESLPEAYQQQLAALQAITQEIGSQEEVQSRIASFRTDNKNRIGVADDISRDRASRLESFSDQIGESTQLAQAFEQAGLQAKALEERIRAAAGEFDLFVAIGDSEGIRASQQSLADLEVSLANLRADQLAQVASGMRDTGSAAASLTSQAGLLENALESALDNNASADKVDALRNRLRELQFQVESLTNSFEDFDFAQSQRSQLPAEQLALFGQSGALEGRRADLLLERDTIARNPILNADEQTASIRRVNAELGKLTTAGQLVITVGEAIGQTLDDSLRGVIEGTKSVAQAFRDLVRDILLSIGKLLVQEGIRALVGIALSAIGSAATSGISGGSSGGIRTSFPASGGAPRAAEGGVVSRGQFALIGEAGPEAVIPLRKFRADQTLGEIIPQLPRRLGGLPPAGSSGGASGNIPRLNQGFAPSVPFPAPRRLQSFDRLAAQANGPAESPPVNVHVWDSRQQAEQAAANDRAAGHAAVVQAMVSEVQRGSGSPFLRALRQVER